MRISRFSCAWVLVSTVALSALFGCSGSAETPPLGQVEGIVTLDGKPLSGVVVSFEPQGLATGGPSIGKTDDQGRYELTYSASGKGALVGTHKVAVTTPTEAPPPPGAVHVDPIPAKFNTASELIKEVKAGGNVINLELTSQ